MAGLGSIGGSVGGSSTTTRERQSAPYYKPKIRDIKRFQKTWTDPAMWSTFGFQSGGAAGRDALEGQETAARQSLADTYRMTGAPGLASNEYFSKRAGLDEEAIASANEQRAKSEEMGYQRAGDIFKSLVQARGMYAGGNKSRRGTSRSFGWDVSGSAGI